MTLLSLNIVCVKAGDTLNLIDQGWAQLIRDNDIAAMKLFGKALRHAVATDDKEEKAYALLYLGICTYGSSINEGLDYCIRSMDEYKKLEKSNPGEAHLGRSRCLQLMSTIYARQKKFREAINIGKEALSGFSGTLSGRDISYPGLIYSTVGGLYGKLNMQDSSAYFIRKSLEEHIRTQDSVYLPSAYSSVARLEMEKGDKLASFDLFNKALGIGEATGNRQAIVSSLNGFAKWEQNFGTLEKSELILLKAGSIAMTLSDRAFYLRTLMLLVDLKKEKGDYKSAQILQEKIASVKDSVNLIDNQKTIERLKVQFEVGEMDRKLSMANKEKEVVRLTNFLLWGAIFILIIVGSLVVFLLKRINTRDKQLLVTKEHLMNALEARKKLEKEQLNNEIEYKESQLSAMTLQMIQKNELMHALQERILAEPGKKDDGMQKIINKGLNQDQEWSDFNAHFESINKNFYIKLKSAYPGISQNDLKLCALIKLNLSIKEMAGILNISPDSVKTARYRLRKKLALNTEDNLSDFILGL